MKKAVIALVVVIVLAAGGYLGWKYFINGQGGKTSKNAANFMWGVIARPSALGRYHISGWNQQLDTAKQLGIKWIRLTWDPNAGEKFHDEAFQAVWDHGMDILLVVEPANFDKVKNPQQEGYNMMKPIVSRYKGKIKYYQILNEVGSTALKSGQYPGTKENDYDQKKYERVRDWIVGAGKAVRENDPNAKIILTDQWTHFAFFDMIEDDNVDYDYLGWNWFSDMGFLGDKTLDDGTKVFDKLKSFNKPIILTEVNYRPDDKTGQPEDKQADFIKRMADFAWKNNDVISGFFVHELVDLTNTPKGKFEYYGIVKAQKTSSGTYVIGQPKKAFGTYKDLISQYSPNK